MSIDFRCENCGKLLSVEGEPGSSTKCPHCAKKVAVPAVVASLPRPLVAPNAPPATPSPARNPETAPTQHVEEEAPIQDGEVMTVMARIMPWIISVFFHVGIAMILAFATMMVQGASGNNDNGNDEVIVPDAAWSDEPGGSISPTKDSTADPSKSTVARNDYAKREAVADAGLSSKRAAISVAGGISSAGGGGDGKGNLLGLRGGGGGGPKSNLFGKGGNAHHVVYVIDRSGSMMDSFDKLRAELLNSISKLKPVQDFHVIFFATGNPKENPPQQLVTASPEYRQQAAEFLAEIKPEGQTDPIPAIQRAFQVLDKADARKKGKLLYLLTDGAFPDNKKVEALIKQCNSGGKEKVFVCTFLYGDKEKEAATFLEKLAKDNGGHFKIVTDDE